ncbi:MAG: ABC transporter ATP-binding protein [Chloroflexia bacterium]
MLEVTDLTKVYHMSESVDVHALRGVSFTVNDGELVAVMGPSGSGKSTIMNVLGCLDRPTSGSYRIDGQEVATLSDGQLAVVRNKQIGFVFQSFNLLSRTNALHQVELPMIYNRSGQSAKERRNRARAALEVVGLGDRLDHLPNQLSGGQQQRVAIARALVNNPAIILADEPTGNLDSIASAEIMAIFQKLNSEQNITVVFVTHEPDIAAHTRRILRMRDGHLVADEVVEHPVIADPGAAREEAFEAEAADAARHAPALVAGGVA